MLDPSEPVVGALDLAVPQIPLRVGQRLLQLRGAFCVQASQALEALAQMGHLHAQMEPIKPMLRMRTQVALELTEAVLPGALSSGGGIGSPT